MYGANLSNDWIKKHCEKIGTTVNDFYDLQYKYSIDSAYNDKIIHYDSIFCLMGEKYTVMGRVLAKSSDGECIADDEPYSVPPILPYKERESIVSKVKEIFGIEGFFDYYLITHYR